MQYIEAIIHTSREGIEVVTAMLEQMGIDSVSINDPRDIDDILDKKETYQWDYIDDEVLEMRQMEPLITAYFEDNEAGRRQIHSLNKAIAELHHRSENGEYGANTDLGKLYIEDRLVCDDDWKDKWKEYFKPAHITKDIVIKPTWEDYEQATGEMIIEIDPGMAFGTGTHETTSSCIELMEKYMKKRESAKDKDVLDVGCGSGILSVAAALLGSKSVLGIEIDPEAVKVAKENIKHNNVNNVATVIEGDLTKGVDFLGDIVVANLTVDLIVMLTADVKKHLKPGGVFISSGILSEKKEKALQAMKNEGFEILEVVEKGEWCAIAAQ